LSLQSREVNLTDSEYGRFIRSLDSGNGPLGSKTTGTFLSHGIYINCWTTNVGWKVRRSSYSLSYASRNWIPYLFSNFLIVHWTMITIPRIDGTQELNGIIFRDVCIYLHRKRWIYCNSVLITGRNKLSLPCRRLEVNITWY
jgi:hypothetical protein